MVPDKSRDLLYGDRTETRLCISQVFCFFLAKLTVKPLKLKIMLPTVRNMGMHPKHLVEQKLHF